MKACIIVDFSQSNDWCCYSIVYHHLFSLYILLIIHARKDNFFLTLLKYLIRISVDTLEYYILHVVHHVTGSLLTVDLL